MIIFGIIVAIFIFSIVVVIHEIGHFSAARKFGVKVEEFGLGLPPKAKTFYKDDIGTTYTLNWLPLGGFVRLTGESPYSFNVYDENKNLLGNTLLEKAIKEGKGIFSKDGQKLHKSEKDAILKQLEENNAPYNLMKKPIWQQCIVILAGVFMNFVLAFTIFFILFFVGVKPIGINDTIKMEGELKLIPTFEQAIDRGIIYLASGVMVSPMEGSIAEKAGLLEGDVIYEVNICESAIQGIDTCSGGEEMQNIKIFEPQNLMDVITANPGKELLFLVNRDSQKPKYIAIDIPETGKIGTYLGGNLQINQDFRYKYSLLDSVKYAFLETKNQVVLTFKGIGYLIDKIFTPENEEERQEAIDSMSGPIGIVDFISSSLKAGITFMIVFIAIISINLGVFNLLPIPALDGGRFLFILINGIGEKLFGKKVIGETSEAIVHLTFFVLLIALSLIIAYNDITKIFDK